jgi:hypothetical protein
MLNKISEDTGEAKYGDDEERFVLNGEIFRGNCSKTNSLKRGKLS